jgi:cobalamin biosynthesis protein CobD/CbiB
MLCALINPNPEALTDFGAMFPVMVLINAIFFSAMLFSTRLFESLSVAAAMERGWRKPEMRIAINEYVSRDTRFRELLRDLVTALWEITAIP